MPKGNGVSFPADLSSLSDEELGQLETDAMAEFDELTSGDVKAEALAKATKLADGLEAVKGEKAARETAAAEAKAQLAELKSRVKGGDKTEEAEQAEEVQVTDEPAAEPQLVAGGAKKTDVRDVLKDGNNLNARLSDAARLAGKSQGPRFAEPVLVASADIRGFTQGGTLDGYKDLTAAMVARARTLPDGKGAMNYVPVAQLQREFKYKADDASPLEDVYAIMQEAASPSALVAAGGWCAPSEISYDFFNIVCEDGMLDVPTIGIRRGGLRWPTSPSFGDLASSTGLWVWNETQDIAALTGTAQSGSKTCAHVPCAAYNEARLDCDGICITAGNLSTDAWPEQLSNYLRLVMAAHAHRVNTRLISKIATASVPVTGMGVTGQGVAVPILDSIELQVFDYRTKYAMCDDATLEAVFPNWVKGMIRADLAKRKGWDSPNSAFLITDAEIAAWFTLRSVSVQFVQDWQVRTGAGSLGNATAATAWPASVSFLLFAAGTWVKGNGLSLDLGVIRDSVLNATNDYTAAWSEDCWLVAQIGHESRNVTIPLCANGAVGSDVTYACPAL